jgi:hypothetical protein
MSGDESLCASVTSAHDDAPPHFGSQPIACTDIEVIASAMICLFITETPFLRQIQPGPARHKP